MLEPRLVQEDVELARKDAGGGRSVRIVRQENVILTANVWIPLP
jgi:hypothetical protein